MVEQEEPTHCECLCLLGLYMVSKLSGVSEKIIFGDVLEHLEVPTISN